MNRVFSTKEPNIINGSDMKCGDFGIVVEVYKKANNGYIKVNENVYKFDNYLLRLTDGYISSNANLYNVKLQDSITIQRIK